MKMKKLMAVLLTVTLIAASTLCTTPIAYAGTYENQYNPIVTHTAAPVIIDANAENVITYSAAAVTKNSTHNADMFFVGDSVTYTFTISEAGTYAMWNFMKETGDLSFDIELDGDKLVVETNKIDANTLEHNYGRIGNIELTAAEHTVKYTITGDSSLDNNSNYFELKASSLKLKKVSDIPVSSADTTLLRHADYYDSNMSETGRETWESDFSKDKEIITPDFGTITRPTYTGQWSGAGYFIYSLSVPVAGMYYATYYTSNLVGSSAYGERSYEIGVSDVSTGFNTSPESYLRINIGDKMAADAVLTGGSEAYPEKKDGSYTQLYKSIPTPVYLAEGTNYLYLSVKGDVAMGGFLTIEKGPENAVISSKGVTYVPSRMYTSTTETAGTNGYQVYRFGTNTDSIAPPSIAVSGDAASEKYSKFPLFHGNNKIITYNVTAEADGLYNLKLDSAVESGTGTVALTVNGVSMGSKTVSQGTTSPVINNIPLKQGNNTLVFDCSTDSYGSINYLVFEAVSSVAESEQTPLYFKVRSTETVDNRKVYVAVYNTNGDMLGIKEAAPSSYDTYVADMSDMGLQGVAAAKSFSWNMNKLFGNSWKINLSE